MIRIEALPAQDGDCLWVEWDHDRRWHRMLIDGGRGGLKALPSGLAERFARQPMDWRRFELVVCTHLDVDHIGGLLALLADPPQGFHIGEMWFNGRHHLTGDVLGPRQGDTLSSLLAGRSVPWNVSFGGDAVVVPDQDLPPVITLPGMSITLLSPTWDRLRALARAWPEVAVRAEQDVAAVGDVLGDRDAGIPLDKLAIANYAADESAANGSSIAFIAEHGDGSRVLFGADAHAEVLVSTLRRLQPVGAYHVDLCKAPHHASKHNISPELLAVLDCQHWLISTNGARHGHPDRRAVARIIGQRNQPVLWFNYRSATTAEFASSQLAQTHGFRAVHPSATHHGLGLGVAHGHVQRL